LSDLANTKQLPCLLVDAPQEEEEYQDLGVSSTDTESEGDRARQPAARQRTQLPTTAVPLHQQFVRHDLCTANLCTTICAQPRASKSTC